MSREKPTTAENLLHGASIARRLRELRARLAHENPDFSMMTRYTAWLCIKHSTYDSWEKGYRSPRAEELIPVVEKTGVNASWLITGSGPLMLEEMVKERPVVSETPAAYAVSSTDRIVAAVREALPALEAGKLCVEITIKIAAPGKSVSIETESFTNKC